jgi:hypothetical protein
VSVCVHGGGCLSEGVGVCEGGSVCACAREGEREEERIFVYVCVSFVLPSIQFVLFPDCFQSTILTASYRSERSTTKKVSNIVVT